MDESEQLDQIIFDTIIPLPYRILFLIQLGHLLWYLIVYGCYKINNLNVLQLINLSYSSHNYPQLGDNLEVGEEATVNEADIQENDLLLKGIWINFRIISVNTIISYIIYKSIQIIFVNENDHDTLKLLYHLIPLITMMVICYKIFHNNDRKSIGKLRIFTTMKRILTGNINSSTMRTNDILISDSLMSYSKVLNDIGIFIWHYFISDEMHYNEILEFLILCLPSMIRIRQCWNEFTLTGNKAHFLNLLKYVSGLSPIFINFLIKFNIEQWGEDEGAEKDQHLQFIKTLNMIWYLASFVNSTYSFIWDVKMDWGFSCFDGIVAKFNHDGTTPAPTTRNIAKSLLFLRPDHQLIYTNKLIYYLAIVIDFILRYLWVFKIVIIHDAESSPIINRIGLFLFGYDAFSFGYCLIEVLEILRRFMWCFFKLESDWFKLKPQPIELTKFNQ